MKYVINAFHSGGYYVPWQVQQVLGCGIRDNSDKVRTNPYFVEWVEANAGKTELAVVEIPDEATDWGLYDYNGFESIIVVIDGKMRHIR